MLSVNIIRFTGKGGRSSYLCIPLLRCKGL